MTAVFDTYCTSERSEFSLYGNFLRSNDDSKLDIALIKSDKLEIYEISKDNHIQCVTSSRLLLTPVACCTIKGVDGVKDYIMLLFMNLEIIIYRYSIEYNEIELVSKDKIAIDGLFKDSNFLIENYEIIDLDENIKLEQIKYINCLNKEDISFMITTAKYLLFISYKINLYEQYDQKFKLGICWGILSETDILMDTIIDSCLILDENSQTYLQPKIAILTRIGPISNSSIQSHSNCVSLIYLSLNMGMTEFTILEKLELLPMDSFKLVPFDTRKKSNICLSGGLIVIARSCVIIHGGLQRPFTLITINGSYEEIPEKKLEIDICTQKIYSFKPKTFGYEIGNTSNNSSTGNDSNVSPVNLSTKDDLNELLFNLQPVFINEPNLSIELDIAHSIPFIITNQYYGLFFFNRIQPYLIGLILQLSNEKPNGIKNFYWIKIHEYWDWTKSYIPFDKKIINLEATQISKKLSKDTKLDEYYLFTITPIFPVQKGHFIPRQYNNDGSLLLVGDYTCNSGISLLNINFKGIFCTILNDLNTEYSFNNSLLNYNAIINLIKFKENGQTSSFDWKNKKIRNDSNLVPLKLEDLERSYINSDISYQVQDQNEFTYASNLEFELLDFLDLGPNSLRDFCIIPNNTVELNETNGNKPLKSILDENHSILSTNGTYPIGQLSLYERSIPKYVIAKFSLDDILFHWTLDDPITGKTKYLVFTTDPLKSIGKTYFFSLDIESNGSKNMNNQNNNGIIVGDVNQLDPTEGNYDFESDSNTVGVGVIYFNRTKDRFVIQALPSTINILDYEISKRVLEIDLAISLFPYKNDAPMAIKCFTLGNYIIILFEDSSIKFLSFMDIHENSDKNNLIAEFGAYIIKFESMCELNRQLEELSEINQVVIKQRVRKGDLIPQIELNYDHRFWFRHISPMISKGYKLKSDLLVVLVIYSKIWLNGSLAIYNLVQKKIVFFSPYISAVPSLLGNVISHNNNREEIIYKFLECEFDLGRPITSISTPVIEPKFYTIKDGYVSITTSILFQRNSISQNSQVSKFTTGSSFLISSELIKINEDTNEMILIASISERPTLIYRLNRPKQFLNMNDLKYVDPFFERWNLFTQSNFNTIQAEINKFFPLFPSILTPNNIEEIFSNEYPLSIYNCGHAISFSSKNSDNVKTWLFQPPSPINNEEDNNKMIDSNENLREPLDPCLPIALMCDRRRLSVVNIETLKSINCLANIDSPWSSLQILLTTSINSEIKFQYLNLPRSSNTKEDIINKTLSTIPFSATDNWFLRRIYLPEIVIQRVAYCKRHNIVAIIAGIPDNAKHHLNGYHIRQMAFYRYLRCLEAGGKEAQTILLNQDLIRNPEKCFEKSLTSIPDLGIPSVNFDSETYFDTLPPGIEIGEILPKLVYQSNKINQKTRNNEEKYKDKIKKFEEEQFNPLLDLKILRNELLIFSMEDLFPQLQPSISLLCNSLNEFPKPIGRFAFGAWEVGLSLKFGQDSKGQDILIVGTGTNPTHYFEAEGRLLMFKVKQLFSINEENLNGEFEVRENINPMNNNKWSYLSKYWPSKFAQELYHNNVQELEAYFCNMYRGPVTCVDLINLPATTASIAPAIPALAAYPIIQNNSIVRVPTSNVTYLSHTFGYRLYIHELRDNDGSFVKGTFMDTPLGISSISNYKALFFLGDIRRGIHFGMLRTDASRGSQTMVKLARSHPLWKFTCTSAQAIVQDREMAILVSDNKNNLFTFEPNFNATQIIDKETLKPTSHTFINTSIVHMRTIQSGNKQYVIASGRNGSFFSIKLTSRTQHEQLLYLEKLLLSNLPSFLGISSKITHNINLSQESIPKFVRKLYSTDKIFFLKHFDYLKYLSNPILKSIFKNSNISLDCIHQFIV